MDVKETIINECLNVLHRKEVKEEFKELMRPLIDMLITLLISGGSALERFGCIIQLACS